MFIRRRSLIEEIGCFVDHYGLTVLVCFVCTCILFHAGGLLHVIHVLVVIVAVILSVLIIGTGVFGGMALLICSLCKRIQWLRKRSVSYSVCHLVLYTVLYKLT